jgi:ATP-dependent helicase HepA
VELLRKLDPKKVLVIGRTIEKAEALDAALRRHLTIKTGIFHEGLTLVQRDRNAAWFAEPEGARLLLCSEIGSEGRNFQFAQHLILFDLPLNPELLEKRIGRLDRIGQTSDFQIHVPYLAQSPQEVLARWFHEGLNALESNLEGGNELLRQFGRAVHDLALEFPVADRDTAEQELADLLEKTKQARQECADASNWAGIVCWNSIHSVRQQRNESSARFRNKTASRIWRIICSMCLTILAFTLRNWLPTLGT